MNNEIKRGPGRPRKIETNTQGEPSKAPLSASGDDMTVVLHYDVWETEDLRHYAGSTVPLPVDMAERLIGLGKASIPTGDE
jgi:hypothetical protein